jgi:hypothetical protein
MTLTRTVEDAKVRARVNSPHMIPLNTRLSMKKSYEHVRERRYAEERTEAERIGNEEWRTPRMVNSTILFEGLRLNI